MKVFVICHVEKEFDLTGDLEILAGQIVRTSNLFDEVINVTCTEAYSDAGGFDVIDRQNFRTEHWLYGLDIDYYLEDEPESWKLGDNYIETTGHPYSEILPWMKELSKSDSYTLVGGSRYECLLDVYEIFQHLDLNVKILEDHCYGC